MRNHKSPRRITESALGDFILARVMAEPETDIIQITKDFWRERTGEEISATEAQEIVDNVSNFFRILSEWDQEDKEKQNAAN